MHSEHAIRCVLRWWWWAEGGGVPLEVGVFWHMHQAGNRQYQNLMCDVFCHRETCPVCTTTSRSAASASASTVTAAGRAQSTKRCVVVG